MADWKGILEKGIGIFTNYVINQYDRVVDNLSMTDADKFRRIYDNKANFSDAKKEDYRGRLQRNAIGKDRL